MKEAALLRLVKPFLPDLKVKAGDSLNNLLSNIIAESDKQMNSAEDEAYTGLLVVKKGDECHIISATFSSDDRLKRVLESKTIKQFSEQLISLL